MNKQEQDDKLETWLGRHRGLLLKVARSFGSDGHNREDLLQEIAFQVWKSIPRYKDEIAESTWIYRVALYTAISWSRKESKRKASRTALTQEPASDDSSSDPRVEWLYEKISELELIDRSLTLLLLDGFSYREMSETLGLTESNVGVRISRIKKQLSERLQRERENEL